MKTLRLRKSILGSVAAFALIAPGIIATVHAQQSVSASLPLPLQVNGSITEFDCQNNPGPWITFEGSAVFTSGLSVQLIFRNNINKDVHVHTEELTATAVVIAAGDSIVIPKQPVQGGVGGNPFIWVQLVDSSGNPLTGEIFIGRCVQGPVDISPTVLVPSDVLANVLILDCTNNPGPFIEVDGQLTLKGGINARFIFRNNDNPVGGPHEAVVESTAELTIIPSDFTLKFAKQPVLGGAGGNPWISVRFADASGNPVSNETLLGRCVQLQPGN